MSAPTAKRSKNLPRWDFPSLNSSEASSRRLARAPGRVRARKCQSGTRVLRAAETASVTLVVKVIPLGVHELSEIEPAITQFALTPKGGLIIAPHPLTRGKLIIDLAAKYQLPAIYPFAFHARDGGLVSYGIDQVDQWRSAAIYVDRSLRGTKPADLPVQQPSKYELVINLKTAKALELAVPENLLALADEVIE
jgi:putative tryptophan/tyrosine transport system substrate-binding protein